MIRGLADALSVLHRLDIHIAWQHLLVQGFSGGEARRGAGAYPRNGGPSVTPLRASSSAAG